MRKFDRHMTQVLASVTPRGEAPDHLELALCSIVRELARLQIQIEVLQQQIEDVHSIDRQEPTHESQFSVVGQTS